MGEKEKMDGLHYKIHFIHHTTMSESLKERVDQVVWDTQSSAFVAARILVLKEMQYRLLPNIIWDLEMWARKKAEEHKEAHARIELIILAVKQNADASAQGSHLALEKLSRHHKHIASRYADVVRACKD